jgi:hypothetical protein
MNRVNMKQTTSTRESSNYAANRELVNLQREKDTLLEFKANGTLIAIGKRQLARCEKRIAELQAEVE